MAVFRNDRRQSLLEGDSVRVANAARLTSSHSGAFGSVPPLTLHTLVIFELARSRGRRRCV